MNIRVNMLALTIAQHIEHPVDSRRRNEIPQNQSRQGVKVLEKVIV
jgi:hypothetical protein